MIISQGKGLEGSGVQVKYGPNLIRIQRIKKSIALQGLVIWKRGPFPKLLREYSVQVSDFVYIMDNYQTLILFSFLVANMVFGVIPKIKERRFCF